MFYLEEPEFPASMLFGLCLGLALRRGCEDLVGVRQSGALLAVHGAESLHQGLQLVLLLLKVQLDTITQEEVEVLNFLTIQIRFRCIGRFLKVVFLGWL